MTCQVVYLQFYLASKKIQTLLPFLKFRQKLANSEVTKEALNCTASIAADSIVDAISFIQRIVL